MAKNRFFILAIILVVGLGRTLSASGIELKQQFNTWFSLNDDKPSTPRMGWRYQPTLSLAKATDAKWKFASEVSLDMFVSASAQNGRSLEFDGNIKPYRLWLRLSSSQFEARLGLQKINFGPATVFRPLMWFDRIDPRDPLQITAGVYGLLLRYYFKNNANIWLWGLLGNPDAKGWEIQPTADHTPEFGGRFQAPLFSGEAGVAVHHRQLAPGSGFTVPRSTESRFALDGKWDLGFGLWVEASFTRKYDQVTIFPWRRAIALGSDYTFKLGNGLYILAEQFFSHGSAAPLGNSEEGISFSALLTRYPLGILDNLSTIIYYDWLHDQMYGFASWQRTYDHWQFHLLVFSNPRQPQIIQTQSGNNMFSGNGFQVMAVWNI